MPLAFDSLSHGSLPFGFFNIATDMLLLNDHFVFASDFCGWMIEWASTGDTVRETRPFWVADRPEVIGNLHRAMAGEDHGGLIGAVYERYPFPTAARDFKQDPAGYVTRPFVEPLAERLAGPARSVPVVADRETLTFSIGPYVFDAHGLGALAQYLWRGGMPRWRNDRRPAYVDAMTAAIEMSASPLFAVVRGDTRPSPA